MVNFREKFWVSSRTILKKFSAVDTQTAVLISTAEVWISAPDTQAPISLGFLGIHSWLWFCLPGDKNFRLFSWSACHENSSLSTSSVQKPDHQLTLLNDFKIDPQWLHRRGFVVWALCGWRLGIIAMSPCPLEYQRMSSHSDSGHCSN